MNFQVEQIRADIRDFRQSSGVDKVIVLWTANTERFCDIVPGVNDSAKNLLAAIQVRAGAFKRVGLETTRFMKHNQKAQIFKLVSGEISALIVHETEPRLCCLPVVMSHPFDFNFLFLMQRTKL